MMMDKIIRTLYTYINYTSTMFVVVEPLVHLITREELVAMAKVTTDFPGSLVLQVAQVYSNITLARLPVTNCKSVTSLSRTVSAAEER